MIPVLPLLLSLATGCFWDEGLIIENLRGTVVIPREAATRVLTDAGGQPTPVTDVRFIGPVYLGLYPSVREGLLEYPHPEIGPVFTAGVAGDAYPYGGTTVGDFRFACLEFLSCRTVSGRFVDFDDMLSWFNDVVGLPIPDALGQPVTNGDYIRQTCYEMMAYTSDEEIRLTATDRNGDGVVDTKDLDFLENAEGDFEGAFTLWQQEYFADADGAGFSLWGWMDAPSDERFQFSTCNPADGYRRQEYASEFFGGTQYYQLLNQPSQYISGGDWVAGPGEYHVYTQPDDEVRIRLGFEVKQ